MYSYKQMEGAGYVIHDESGCSLPYHSKVSKYTTEVLMQHGWKLDYFKEWFSYSNSQRLKVKGMWTLQDNCVVDCVTVSAKTKTAFAHCSKAEPACGTVSIYGCKQEGTNPMYNNIDKTDVSRNYLTGRLNEVGYAKRDQLRKLFNLDAIAIPKSYKDLIAAIKDGKYEINAKAAKHIDYSIEEEGRYYGSPLDGIIFTDFPKPDYEGHAVAVAAQMKEATKVKDAIYGPSYEVAQKALTDFEAWVPEGKA